nr:hypothetical protein [Tanacetum cinerariifolium]
MDVHENESKKPNSFYVEKPFESLQSSSNEKPIILDDDSEDGVTGEAVGLNALIEALDTAMGMRIKVVHVLCDSDQRQY